LANIKTTDTTNAQAAEDLFYKELKAGQEAGETELDLLYAMFWFAEKIGFANI